MTEKKTLTLIVLDTEAGPDDDADLPPDSVELQGVADKVRGLWAKPKPVPMAALKERMEEVQAEVGELLAGLKKPVGNYRLAEVQVSLAISGSGSIGVATVGAEASIALTFAPSS